MVKILHIPINQAVPGMIAAEDLYTFNDQLIIAKGTKLNDKIISRLSLYSITHLRITFEIPKPMVKESSHSEVTKDSVEFKKFNETFVESVQDFKGELKNIITDDSTLDTDTLLEHTNKLLSSSRNGIHVFDMLHCMREYDDLTFVHSINVSLICNILGTWLKLSPEDIDGLTLSGLLHDIGKLTLPPEILNKNGPLTDEEYAIVKTHTVRGYQTLKSKDIDPRVKYAALMHHERCDGSGYPNKFHAANIDSFAKIVAIADVYDAMTSARVYRPALSPFEAISIFEADGLQKYDPHYIMTFLEEIVQSYVGNRVRLSNQLEGVIIMINKNHLSKPVIQVGDRFFDISKEQNIVIEAIL